MRIICLPTSPSLQAVGNRESNKMRGQNKTQTQTNSSLCQIHLTRNVSSAGPMLQTYKPIAVDLQQNKTTGNTR